MTGKINSKIRTKPTPVELRDEALDAAVGGAEQVFIGIDYSPAATLPGAIATWEKTQELRAVK